MRTTLFWERWLGSSDRASNTRFTSENPKEAGGCIAAAGVFV